jgi:signal transduction histidine kinase
LRRRSRRSRNVTLSLVHGEDDVTALCDRDRILQVFANLLGNALKFTPASGTIIVSQAVVGDEVQLSITDTGPGIPAELRSRVFDRFWRNKESTNAGSGLGLAICKGIIEQHGGRIWVDGRAGAGAVFVFTIPLR